jgi:hypothetical protein
MKRILSALLVSLFATMAQAGTLHLGSTPMNSDTGTRGGIFEEQTLQIVGADAEMNSGVIFWTTAQRDPMGGDVLRTNREGTITRVGDGFWDVVFDINTESGGPEYYRIEHVRPGTFEEDYYSFESIHGGPRVYLSVLE